MKNPEAVVLVDPVGSGEPLKASAKEMGLKVIAVFALPIQSYENYYHLTRDQLVQECDAVIFSGDKPEVLRELRDAKFSIKGVIAASEGGVEMADQIAHELHLWGNPIELSRARRHKGEMRKIFKKSNLSCPDFTTCTSEKEVIALCPLFEGGKVQKILGIEAIEQLESYDSHILHIHEGDSVQPSTHLATTPLLVYLAHEDQSQLLKDTELAHELFVVELKKRKHAA